LKFTDFKELTYRFEGAEALQWSEDGATFKEEYCQITEFLQDSNLFFVHHLRSYTFPLEAFTFVIDMENGLVTLVHASVGTFKRPREVDREFHFGTIEGFGSKDTPLHNFTEDMVGLIVDWFYDKEQTFIAKHFYVDHLRKFDRIIREGVTTYYSAVTCDYIKIREGIYIMSWVETYGQGVQGTALIDMKHLHDVGSFFGINREGTLDSYSFAAYGILSDKIGPVK